MLRERGESTDLGRGVLGRGAEGRRGVAHGSEVVGIGKGEERYREGERVNWRRTDGFFSLMNFLIWFVDRFS